MAEKQTPGTILVVDDEWEIRGAVTTALAAEGYDVVSSSNATDAIVKLMQAKFDIAIVDILMPDLSGFDLINMMNKICPETVPIVLTAMKDTKEQFSKTAESSGVFAFMTKPWRIAELSETVSKAMSYKQVLHDNRRLTPI